MQYCDFITQIAYNHPKTTTTTTTAAVAAAEAAEAVKGQNGNARCNGLEVGAQGVAGGNVGESWACSSCCVNCATGRHFAWEWHKNHISVLLFAVNENANKIGFSVPHKKPAK